MITSASKILRRHYIKGDSEKEARIERHRKNSRIAQEIHDLRKAAGLTQQQLAERVGASASSISRLEDADDEGHSLSMLRRIAEALGSEVKVSLLPRTATAPAPGIDQPVTPTEAQPVPHR